METSIEEYLEYHKQAKICVTYKAKNFSDYAFAYVDLMTKNNKPCSVIEFRFIVYEVDFYVENINNFKLSNKINKLLTKVI